MIEIKESGDRAKDRLNKTKNQIRQRTLARWQEEWSAADTGRLTHSLISSIEERQEMKLLNDIDHGVIQLLTGHGFNKSYLRKFKRADSDECEDCGSVEDAFHPIIFCQRHEYVRDILHEKASEVGQLPWNISTLIRDQSTYKALETAYITVCDRRQI